MAIGMSDLIARFIRDALEETGGEAELQRGQIAAQFGCVPSQINYVISTRFSPEHGYMVESRRGGGGYIRITRVDATPERVLMHAVNAIGPAIGPSDVRVFLTNLLEAGVLDAKTARIILAAVSDRALAMLPPETRDTVRAGVFKETLLRAGQVM